MFPKCSTQTSEVTDLNPITAMFLGIWSNNTISDEFITLIAYYQINEVTLK